MNTYPLATSSREFRSNHAARSADRIGNAASDEEVSAILWDVATDGETTDSSVAIILEANTLLAARIARWLRT